MALELTVMAANTDEEEKWSKELRLALARAPMDELCNIRGSLSSEAGQVIFVDARASDAFVRLSKIDRRGRAVFLLVRESEVAPRELLEGVVDDVLLYPLRPLEVMSRIRHYRQILMWDEVTRLNESFAGLLDRMREDVGLAERMQKSKLPLRFPDIKGLRAQSRYLAGIRAGGDHFDLAESKDGQQLTMVLTDSSSYGLSSAVLSSLMSVTLKLTADELRSSLDTVRKIHTDLAATLGQKDRLSMFYGVLNKRDFTMRFLSIGSACAFYAPADGKFRALPSQAPAITSTSTLSAVAEQELRLEPQDRLVILSDGFVEAAGGTERMLEVLDDFRARDAIDVLNEMAFKVKSKLTEPDDMPEQDCTALIIDVDSRVIRLAPGARKE